MDLKKRGVSPFIATVLLIVIAIVLALIIFLWARGFVKEKAVKFDRAVELSCPDVNFEAGIALDNGDYVLDTINRGNVPIGGFKLTRIEDNGATAELINELLDATINSGQSTSVDLSGVSLSSGTVVRINPIIFGKAPDGGKVPHICGEISVDIAVA